MLFSFTYCYNNEFLTHFLFIRYMLGVLIVDVVVIVNGVNASKVVDVIIAIDTVGIVDVF